MIQQARCLTLPSPGRTRRPASRSGRVRAGASRSLGAGTIPGVIGAWLMDLTVLAVPGCPNVAVLEQRLASLLAGRPGVRVSRHVVDSGEEAARLGMHGSPTLLIDGSDPFPAPGAGPALACRLYPSDGGPLEGAPAVSALRQALAQAGLPE